MALSDAERAARYRERRKASEKPVIVRYHRPADRRSKAKQLDGYQEWRDNRRIGQRYDAAPR
jgi:hypothetical protein